MKRTAIHFDAAIPLAQIVAILQASGMHLRHDGRGLLLADAVPRFVTSAAAQRALAAPNLCEVFSLDRARKARARA